MDCVILGLLRVCGEGFQGEFVELHFRNVRAVQPPRRFQVSDEFAGGRQGIDAGCGSECYVGSVVGGLNESGGAWGVARQGDYDVFEGTSGFQCLFVQNAGVNGVLFHRVYPRFMGWLIPVI